MALPAPVERQREVVCLPAVGHQVVLGTAGSGKTTMATAFILGCLSGNFRSFATPEHQINFDILDLLGHRKTSFLEAGRSRRWFDRDKDRFSVSPVRLARSSAGVDLDRSGAAILGLAQAKLVPADALEELKARAMPGESDKVANQARALREWFRGFVCKHMGRPLTAKAFRELGPLNRLLERDEAFNQILRHSDDG